MSPERGAPVSVPGVVLGDVLGAGAFGTVRRGRHRFLDIDVAVKLIDLGSADRTVSGQLLQEARLMARLDHPNLLRVFDAGPLERHLYLVLEFMDGGSCAGVRALPAAAAADAGLQLLSGLQALHEARILHRDIKPANCLKRRDDRIKLADLGLAFEPRSAETGAVETAGTVPFMAPELFDRPPRYSAASDLYALGMTLASFVLDAPPYPRGGLSDLLPWIVSGPRPSLEGQRPDLPPQLCQLITRMISPRSSDRPQTAAEALRDLGAAGQPSPSDPMQAAAGHEHVGPWMLGSPVYSSSNWDGWTVTHGRTGAPGRIMRLKPDGPLRAAASLVLEAAERAARIEDRLVVPVLDWGLWSDRVYVVTAPWGHTLLDLVRARGPFDEVAALRFARDLAEALAGIHRRGLTYQNLDPGSAVVAADARTAQLSWPIYCVEHGAPAQGRIVVPRYAAPEALFGAAPTIEPAVDVFGLGAVLLFLLTGLAPPRDGENIAAFVRAQAPDVTAATASFTGDLLAFAPERRPTAAAALERIGQLLTRLAADPRSDAPR